MKKIEHILNPPHGCQNCNKVLLIPGFGYYCNQTPAKERHRTDEGEWICDKYDAKPTMGFTEIIPEEGDRKNVKISLRGAELRKSIDTEKKIAIKVNYSNNPKK